MVTDQGIFKVKFLGNKFTARYAVSSSCVTAIKGIIIKSLLLKYA
jgi:hypothetical protein